MAKDNGYLSANQIPTAPFVEGYIFLHWLDTSTANTYSNEELLDYVITSDTEIKAIYDNTINVTFLDKDANIISNLILYSNEILEGSFPTAPVYPLYTFLHWQDDEDNIYHDIGDVLSLTENTIIRAIYNDYVQIVFTDDSGNYLFKYIFYANKENDYSEEFYSHIPEGHDLQWRDNDGNIYTLDDILNITENKNLIAVYLIRYYDIVFKDLENNVLSSIIKPHFAIIEESEIPAIEEVDGYVGYWYSEWHSTYLNEVTITRNTTFTLRYNILLTFNFYDNENNYISTIVKEEQTYLQEHEIPSIPDVEYYEFIGWSTTVYFDGDQLFDPEIIYDLTTYNFISSYGNFNPIYKDVKLQMVFEVESYHKIYFNLENTVVELFVEKDTYIPVDKIPVAPIRDYYEFIGWSCTTTGYDVNSIVDRTLSFYPLYERTHTQLFFNDWDNNVIVEIVKEINSVFTITELPAGVVRENYLFIGWESSILKCPYETEEIVLNIDYVHFYPIYKMARTVVFKDFDDNVLQTTVVADGHILNPNEIPEAPLLDGYLFVGWTNNINNPIVKNTEIKAMYEIAVLITVLDHKNNILLEVLIIQLSMFNNTDLPTPPTRENFAFVGWEYEGWGFEVEDGYKFYEDVIFKPIYTQTHFIIIFEDHYGNVVSELIKEKNSYLATDEIPVADNIENHEFVGWLSSTLKVDSVINKDAIFKATYNQTHFTIIFTNNDGSIIDIIIHPYGYFTPSDFPVIEVPEHLKLIWAEDGSIINGYFFVDSDRTIIAYYEELALITFVYHDQTSYIYKELGSILNKSDAPDVARDYYIFEGWEYEGKYLWLGSTVVNRNMTIHANYKQELIDIKVSYYSIERLYYTKDIKLFWFIPIGTEYKYMDFIVYNTQLQQDVWTGSVPNLENIVGTAMYGVPKHLSVSGFDFVGWDNGTENLLPTIKNNHYIALYNMPKVKVNYYSSNNVFIEDTEIDVNFVPLPELKGNIDWFEGLIKYIQDILIKWNFVELDDDVKARGKAREAVEYLSDRYVQGAFEVYFMVVYPDVHIEAGYGIFKSSAASISGGTFMFLTGTSHNNDYVYFAELSGVYVKGLKYSMRVTYETPYDNTINFITNLLSDVGKVFTKIGEFINSAYIFIVENWWRILLFIAGTLVTYIAIKFVIKRF